MSVNESHHGSSVSASTAGRSVSRSMDVTCFAFCSKAMVSVPMPGPISSTLSAPSSSANATIFATIASLTRKFCPSEYFAESP